MYQVPVIPTVLVLVEYEYGTGTGTGTDSKTTRYRAFGTSKYKRCRYRAASAILSSARPTRMTQRQWRRSDRAFRSRGLELHRTLTGRLRVRVGGPQRTPISSARALGMSAEGSAEPQL